MRSFHTGDLVHGRIVSSGHHDAGFSADQISMDRESHLPVHSATKGKWKALHRPQIFRSGRMGDLRNPVHGDRSKADDVSWPFYNAIDEILGHDRATPSNDEYIDPHEFLCVSVTPEEPTSSVDARPAGANPEIDRRRSDLLPDQRLGTFDDDCSLEIERVPSREITRQASRSFARRKREPRGNLVSRLPRATELAIRKATSEVDCSKDPSRARGSDLVDSTRDKESRNEDDVERPRKSRRTRGPYREDHESRTERRIEQIFEYIKQRDEEDRSIMVRIMHAVETIASKL
ncbi:uncharacterized protein LOC143188179 isoform X3 [Calliopsis andreniformis]|uniref:uncharacterized protein LOC143188179 isoform X3 n=1 Tax=Calliopsis andreniformis TaxID=337506 RepID=UPI003FCD7411